MLGIAFLLAAAWASDRATGPLTSTAAFYVLPVALAAWLYEWRASWLVAGLAFTMDLTGQWRDLTRVLPVSFVVATHLERLALFLVVGTLTHWGREHQRQQARDRQQLEVHNRQLREEMEAARDIQLLLLPVAAETDALEIGVLYHPARTLCGDTLDVWTDQSGGVGIFVADVSGKGSPAALAAAVLVGMLDRIRGPEISPGDALKELNERLTARLPPDMFITAFCGRIDPVTGEFVYASAGHEAPLRLHSGQREELTTSGMVLGLSAEATYPEQRVTLGPESLVVVYTDGATDLQLKSGGRLGLESLVKILEENQEKPCRRLLETVEQVLLSRAVDPANIPDDVTMVALRLKRPSDLGVNPRPGPPA